MANIGNLFAVFYFLSPFVFGYGAYKCYKDGLEYGVWGFGVLCIITAVVVGITIQALIQFHKSKKTGGLKTWL